MTKKSLKISDVSIHSGRYCRNKSQHVCKRFREKLKVRECNAVCSVTRKLDTIIYYPILYHDTIHQWTHPTAVKELHGP